jgi:adenylate cyclase
MIYREFLRHFKIYFIIGFVFISLSTLTRLTFIILYDLTDPILDSIKKVGEWNVSFLAIFISSFLMAFFSSLLDVLVLKRLRKNKSLGISIILGVLVQSAMIFLVVVIVIEFFRRFIAWISEHTLFEPTLFDILFVIVHLVLAVGLSKFVIEIDRKLGPGKLWKVLSGKFYHPSEEERIFMFIDMKDSTKIAESLGHMEFSKLLQDCFQDFSIVDRYLGDIYQYVGDEVVVSWVPKKGLKNENFLMAFFAFNEVINSKSDYYIGKYGLLPYFKAGANIGPVVITEVGDIKREITYHGDTVNTASRIQDMCNKLNAQMLIPEKLYNLVKSSSHYNFEDLGSVALKGKEKHIHLYKVTQI